LFLCTGNSARSIMAEAILNRFGAGKFRAFSAGSRPNGRVHPRVVQMLKNFNFDPARYRSKSWDEFARPDAPRLDFVFTVCDRAAQEVCPVWPGQPISAHWGVPDPAAVEGADAGVAAAFADAWRMLQNRITVFAALPIEGLDRLSLQAEIDAIGASLRQAKPREPSQ
jgi:protein-tyrosine-phosphatase